MRAASLAASLGASASSSRSSTVSASTARASRSCAGLEDQHELPLAALGALAEPAGRLAERQARDLLELLGQLAADGELARRPEALGEIGQRVGDAMRRFVEHHRPGQRPAPAAPCAGRRAWRAGSRRTETAARRSPRPRSPPPPRSDPAAGSRGCRRDAPRAPARRPDRTAPACRRRSPARRSSSRAAPRPGRRWRGARCARAARRCAWRCRGARAACAWCACPRRRPDRRCAGSRARAGWHRQGCRWGWPRHTALRIATPDVNRAPPLPLSVP